MSCSFSLLNIHVACMTNPTRRATKKNERNQTNTKLEKLRIGSHTKSLRNDLKKRCNMIFSDLSTRAIYEMGNLESIELRQTAAIIRGPSYLKHAPEGLNMCLCGVWLRSNQSTMDRIRATFATPYYRTAVTVTRDKARAQPMADGPCQSG